ncbi:MAG TPA: SDR family oxidoreductase [Albitalea sp.]
MTHHTIPARTALITGASSGIGKALAEQFARDGHQLVLAARSVGKMEALARDLEQRHGVRVTVIGADLQTPEGAAQLHADVHARGLTISALVNNAGYGAFGEFKGSALAPELAMMQLNMSTVVALTKLFMPDLIATRGKILNTASTAAFQPGPYMAVYYATKAFVLSFSEAIAEELKDTGVTVTALCPGPTASGFQDKADMHASALVKGKELPTAEAVARSGYRAMQRGRRVHIPGAMNWLMAQSPRFVPRSMVTALVKAMSRPA